MLRKLLWVAVIGGLLGLLLLLVSYRVVQGAAADALVDRNAQVKAPPPPPPPRRAHGAAPSGCLDDRLGTALELYTSGRVQRLLLSGDHGQRQYDEVNAMKAWLVERGVPVNHIFLDHAGFDTHDTVVRARKVFQVHDAVLVSQAFHLPRAIYLAKAAGIQVVGMRADPPQGSVCGGSRVREPLACLKACTDVWLGTSPRFLGPPIPITGEPCASFDKVSDKVCP